MTSSVVLLPFTIVFLVLSPAVGKVISRFGNLKPFIAASLTSLIGFGALFVFHANEFQVRVALGTIAIGLALINTVAMNMIMLLTPKHFGGVLVGVVQVFTFTGMAIGPVISGIIMQNYQTPVMVNTVNEMIPSSESYELIFLTAAIASVLFVAMALILRKTIPASVAKP